MAALLAATVAAAPVNGDGDPASDVLLGENVFYPYSPPVSTQLQTQLNAEIATAHQTGFPVKVALIASPTDLGVVPVLFDKPQQYADFLYQEIGFLKTKHILLVVMPNGYGVRGLGSGATPAVSSLGKPAGTRSNDLAEAAIVAVARLAAAAGHPIARASTSPRSGAHSGGTSTALTAVILALACGAVAGAIVIFHGRRRGR